jgi:hypothetical protein
MPVPDAGDQRRSHAMMRQLFSVFVGSAGALRKLSAIMHGSNVITRPNKRLRDVERLTRIRSAITIALHVVVSTRAVVG